PRTDFLVLRRIPYDHRIHQHPVFDILGPPLSPELRRYVPVAVRAFEQLLANLQQIGRAAGGDERKMKVAVKFAPLAGKIVVGAEAVLEAVHAMESADDIGFPIVVTVLDGKPDAFTLDEHTDEGEVIQVV